MSDNKNQRVLEDRSRINITEAYEAQYWAEHFGTTTERLRNAVNRVGPMVSDVERVLRSRGK